MDVTPKTLREVEFREKMRGYHPEDVDQFLEQVAVGLEVLHDRLRQAVERAQRAEQAAASTPDNATTDETLRKTLVLAQRTADLAVQEAREQAARILAAAEQRAQAMLGEAEDLARRVHDESLGDIRSQLTRLEASRAQAQQEVDGLTRWIDDHRTHLTSSLKDALSIVERAGVLAPPPTSRPLDLPFASRSNALRPAGLEGAGTPRPDVLSTGAGIPTDNGTSLPADPGVTPTPPIPPSPEFPESVRAGADIDSQPTGENGSITDEPTAFFAPPRRVTAETEQDSAESLEVAGPGPDEQALDEFFEDDEYSDDRRFGGRLRRRR